MAWKTQSNKEVTLETNPFSKYKMVSCYMFQAWNREGEKNKNLTVYPCGGVYILFRGNRQWTLKIRNTLFPLDDKGGY